MSLDGQGPAAKASAGISVNAPGNKQSPNQILRNVAILDGQGSGANGASYFNPLVFTPVTGGVFGNSGGDILRGPGVVNVDASRFRNFSVKEFRKSAWRGSI